jgi:hypothetical protein
MLTRRNVLGVFSILVLTAAIAGRSRAASIELQPSTSVVVAGSLVGVLIYGTDFPVGTDGGDFSISWSPNLEYVGLEIADPPWDLAAFDDSNAALGYVDYVDVFSSVETPGAGGAPFDIATLTLRAVSEGAASVSLAPDLVGWSVGGESIDFTFGPDAQLDVAAPEPSALPLLALLLGALPGVRLRRRSAPRAARGLD